MAEKDAHVHSWLMERRYFSLIIVLAFVLLSAITFFILYRHYTINMEQTLKEDRSTASLLSLVLDEHLKMIVTVMESYSNRPLLLRAVKDKNVEKASEHLINLAKSNPDIDIVVISDRRGTPWASYPAHSPVLGKNFAHRDWYKGVSKEWKPNISDVVLRVVGEKDLAVQISVPFFDKKGEAIGILVNTQRTVTLSNLIKPVPLDPGTFITVTDRKGQIVYSTRYDVEKEIRPSPFHPDMKKAMAANKKTFAVDDHEFGGRTHYISFAPIVDVGWTVSVGRDKRGIFLSGSAYYVQMTAIAVLMYLTIVLFLFYSRKQVTAQQIQEQLRAAKEILTSETRFRELFNHMSSGVAVYKAIDDGEDFIISDLNQAGQRIINIYTDFIGKSVCDVFPGVKQFGLFEIFQQVWKTGKAERYPSSQYSDDRLTFWAENYVYKLPSGDIVAVFDDITERKQMEEALRGSEANYRQLFDNSPTGIYQIDFRTGKFLKANDAMCKYLGYSQDEITSLKSYDVLTDESKQLFSERLNKMMLGEEVAETPEFEIIDKQGKRRWVELSTKYFYDSEGLAGADVVAHEITERKHAEKQLQDTLESLRKAVGTTIQVLTSAVETRDPYTAGHQTRSADLARAIGTEMELPQEKIDAIRIAGSIHDIGKLSIPAEILSKPNKLSNIEFSLIKEHARKGYEVLKDVESPWPLAEIVYQHHERMDGSGYPRNLKGEEICIEARILAVSDVVEAMASHRPYRPGLGIDAALNEIEKNRGIIYDDAVADACLRLFREKGFQLAGT
jgi:PAS domain S-box-containing protein